MRRWDEGIGIDRGRCGGKDARRVWHGVKSSKQYSRISAMPMKRYIPLPNASVAAWQTPTGRHFVSQKVWSILFLSSSFPIQCIVWVTTVANWGVS